ncbi:MAG: peptide transporter [Myxococcales bacterium]|nr:peptide transporter [Myxococcales bacterium]
MLACVGPILGVLGGITAAYMNFSLGFFVGGQVLAGILGSAVTYGYGPEGKHGANYMQTMAASVASLSGMAVLIQAMAWLGLPQPPWWQLVLYFLCIGMFGIGVGMLYTPMLVDKMQLMFPSGYAVANILRALTDIKLLKQSIGQLGGGTLGGLVVGVASTQLPFVEHIGLSSSTVGAGMVVAARIAIAGATVGVIGHCATPWLREIGWLDANAPFRKIGFILALGTILGAAIVDLVLIGALAVKKLRQPAAVSTAPQEDWKKTDTRKLLAWVAVWGVALYFVATDILQTPPLYVAVAMGLVFLFVMVNGISTGISDSNPISSAFVVTVFILASIGLKEPGVGLLAASILLVSTSVGVDMQQDRSTGWRLGTNRTIQFRYQAAGIVIGAFLAVGLAMVFMQAYPVLKLDQFANPNLPGAESWGSAMTFKFVGALRGLTNPKPYVMTALQIGIAVGLATEIARKLIKRHAGYRAWIEKSRRGFAFDFCLDAVLLPSPYASSFGGFVELPVTLWYAAGGIVTSGIQTWQEHRKRNAPAVAEGEALPEDMSSTALVGGGMIAGDSLAALGVGLVGLTKAVW